MDSRADSLNFGNFAALSQLRADASKAPQANARAAAEQLEGVFLQMLVKQMRSAGFESDLFKGPQMDMYRDLMDKELSLHLAGNGGIGLAEQMERMLAPPQAASDGNMAGKRIAEYGRQLAVRRQVESSPAELAAPPRVKQAGAGDVIPSEPKAFLSWLRPHVEKAAAELGVHPAGLAAQAVLETGWGKSVPRTGNGESSFNLFGIKARSNEAAVEKSTREFRHGQFASEKARFRVFEDMESAMQGVVDFLGGSGRYLEALGVGDNPTNYAEAIGRSGYATDPAYASKLKSIMSRPEFRQFFPN